MSEETVPEVLRKAALLIEPEGAWTQRAGARDMRGEPVGWKALEAVCWCSIAAISVAAGNDSNLASEARIAARKAVGANYLSDWNDDPERTQAEVVQALRTAATLAEERG